MTSRRHSTSSALLHQNGADAPIVHSVDFPCGPRVRALWQRGDVHAAQGAGTTVIGTTVWHRQTATIVDGLTPISPPLVKGTDLLLLVVESRRRATVSDSRQMTAFPFSAVFVSGAGSHPEVRVGSQHLLRLWLRGAKRSG